MKLKKKNEIRYGKFLVNSGPNSRSKKSFGLCFSNFNIFKEFAFYFCLSSSNLCTRYYFLARFLSPSSVDVSQTQGNFAGSSSPSPL